MAKSGNFEVADSIFGKSAISEYIIYIIKSGVCLFVNTSMSS
jgi:hypothetical protein